MKNEEGMEKVRQAIREFYSAREKRSLPGKSLITTGLAVYGEEEMIAMFESLASERLGLHLRGREFEEKFARYMGTNHATLANSGSSASLLALAGIKEKEGLDGGEIITPACGFPTTINPIIQLGFKPVFVDVDKTLNASPEEIEAAISEDTKGIVFAHTLGNPARIDEVMRIARERDLFVVEDCSDAYGSTFNGKPCGSFGDVSIASFYPAHNITLAGEGGAVMTDDTKLNKIIRSLRDWGRDCYCNAGEDDTCGNRFGFKLDGTPYDHKYLFSTIGYNLKPTEAQAAMGLVQLERIERFNQQRRLNYQGLRERLGEFEEFFDFAEVDPKADPVFFGFPIMIRDGQRISRDNLVRHLNGQNIATRYLFGGNLVHQPAYKGLDHRISGNLDYTDKIAKDLFWVGVHPGMGEPELDYIHNGFGDYLASEAGRVGSAKEVRAPKQSS